MPARPRVRFCPICGTRMVSFEQDGKVIYKCTKPNLDDKIIKDRYTPPGGRRAGAGRPRKGGK